MAAAGGFAAVAGARGKCSRQGRRSRQGRHGRPDRIYRPNAGHTVFRNGSIRAVLGLQIPKKYLDLGILFVVVNRRG